MRLFVLPRHIVCVNDLRQKPHAPATPLWRTYDAATTMTIITQTSAHAGFVAGTSTTAATEASPASTTAPVARARNTVQHGEASAASAIAHIPLDAGKVLSLSANLHAESAGIGLETAQTLQKKRVLDTIFSSMDRV